MFRIANSFRGRLPMDSRDCDSPIGSCCGSTPWADIGSAWATRSCWASRIGRRTADVPILGDLSSRHARIRRDGEGYLIEALRDVRVDGRPVHDVGWLRDGSRIQLGESVRLLFRRPHAAERHGPARFRQPAPHAAVGRRRAADGRLVRPRPEAAQPRRLPRLDRGK